ncbi:polysaccharide biosynthesis protein [Massilia glaciei]|uniref:Polysaccharide biosynthesis protein n=1 Tax=Massilia glaciei TaxID=1524097 RepID=A0A2U2HNA3_9BURK|nr:nucleoside-diphosphate sugar epimerase/dehydratase [Massilia glaciei]PWF48895.1 polysaccharide biosynthesis protein [Massilia glaciei]
MKNIFLNLPRQSKQLIATVADGVFLPLVFCVAMVLHLDSSTATLLHPSLWMAVLAPLFCIPVFIKAGLYRAVIRYIDQKIVTTVLVGASVSILMLALTAVLLLGSELTPTFFTILWLNTILYVLTSRFLARGLLQGPRERSSRIRVAIYGAGDAGMQLANALRPGSEYLPVIFIDDNKQLQKATIAGIAVHPSSALPRLVGELGINTVLLAMPLISPQQQKLIIDKLEPLKLVIKITPQIKNLVNGIVRVEDVRQIEIEDLLSREQVAPNNALLSVCIRNKSVCVSGAGGSIGSELCRQILNLSPRTLVLLDISEYSLYAIEQELRSHINSHGLDIELVPFLGSVLDYEKCKDIFVAFKVDTVYHAAAYKHVPLVEHNPIEGIRNNAFGTLSFARAASAAKVKFFVLISTDKAVRPTNVMGSTKRLAELILQAFARQGSNTKFCMVRFGNVLGSSGSVVPLFRRQISSGGPITLTHPDITRYFMTIPEAAQLVIQAGAMGQGGDVFVLDMGQPVRIADLAVRMVHLSGQEVKTAATPKGTIEIKYVGLRPGEKLYEELLIGTNVTGTDHPLIMRAEESEINWPFLEIMLKHLDEACVRKDHGAIRTHLLKIVSEYQPSSEIVDFIWLEGRKKSSEMVVDEQALTETSV